MTARVALVEVMPAMPRMPGAEPPLLSTNLSVDYPTQRNMLHNLQLDIRQGEILGLVGQSGSGKSTLAMALLRLLNHKAGKVRGSMRLNGRELTELSEREMRRVRGREVGLVQQSPLASLNPALRIATQMEEAWKAHAGGSRQECRQRIGDVMAEVRLPCDEEFLRRFPSHLSVGQAQRVLIGMAILHRPSLLVADEPTSALDVITQAEILDLFTQLNRTLGMAILYISHDLLSVAQICHRVAILHEGAIVECAPPARVFSAPVHPYTQRLVASLPVASLPKLQPSARRSRQDSPSEAEAAVMLNHS